MKYKQMQTSNAFSFKWARRDAYESDTVKKRAREWLVRRYFGSEEQKEEMMSKWAGWKILDAGCGSGFSALLLFGKHLGEMQYWGVDISEAVSVAETRFREMNVKGNFVRADIATMQMEEKFDVIFSEGVIHHTPTPFETFKNLVSHLNPGGLIMFYVYRGKAPIREFSDDMIRERIRHLSDEEAWKELMPLTKLGKLLGDLNIEIELDEDIKLLEIPKGKYNLQRFLYWFFIKAYYAKEYSLEEMNHVNFDWYRPLICFRFTPDELEKWLLELNLKKIRFVVEEAGITVVCRKES